MEEMLINIDESSGFCWGVVRTIDKVEEILKLNKDRDVYVLGHIIHNPREIERLEKIGLKTITHKEIPTLAGEDAIVIIRAHGEPPSTYEIAAKYGIELIDATCPLVTSLQKRVKKYYEQGYQIVIFGKRDHAEVVGLRGVCNDECIVIKSANEALEKVDFSRKTVLFSQTTMNKIVFEEISAVLKYSVEEIVDGMQPDEMFRSLNTICKYVSDRDESLRSFARNNDVILFVAGRKSSNGKSLFRVVSGVNPKSFFIEDYSEIDYTWFEGAEKLGITGATSTPKWYLAKVRDIIQETVSAGVGG